MSATNFPAMRAFARQTLLRRLCTRRDLQNTNDDL